MNLPAWTFGHRKAAAFLLLMLLAGGAMGFLRMEKKEDATFMIKSAVLLCSYPGASPFEIEKLITEPIGREVQAMRRLHKLISESSWGRSRVMVELDPGTPAREIPQLWDELRRRVTAVQTQLPAGASPIVVGDDFGDVFGIYYGLSAGEGFSWNELRKWAQQIQTQLVPLDGVRRVTLFGEQSPVVNIYISLATLAGFSIRPETIVATIAEQNRVVGSGLKQAGELTIRIAEEGTYRSVEELSDQLLFAQDGKQYRLGDLARVELEYQRPPERLMSVDGRPAIGIGVASEQGADVVRTGREVARVLSRLEAQMPVGVELTSLYPEDRIAREANNTFLWNLLLSVVIVVAVMVLFMGVRAGTVIGSSLLFAIGGTLLVMYYAGEGLNRTSLAGFIIVMGMLVDNAIVVVDNARQGLAQGLLPREAVSRGAMRPAWSLAGATVIAILSFLPLYLAPSSVAEIVKPLFVVVAVSLLLSWLLAMTQTPLWGERLLRKPATQAESRVYAHVLEAVLRHRWATLLTTVALFAAALVVMGRLPQNFFPEMDKPYFRADVILPDGYDIGATSNRLERMERWLLDRPEVVHVSTTAGGTPPRYYLASGSVTGRPNFGNLLVELHDKAETRSVEQAFAQWVEASMPDVWLRSSLFKLSPVPDAAIEFGFIGPQIDTLVRLTGTVQQMMRRTGRATNIRNSWGNRIPLWQPVYSQMRGQRIGISRSRLAAGLTIATEGYSLGDYRLEDRVIPILLKDERIDSYNLPNLQALPLFSPRERVYPLAQAVDSFRFDYRIGRIERFNRQRVMKAQCDPQRGVETASLFAQLASEVAAIKLPDGYSMRIFGEQESQAESNRALAEYMPLTMVLILLVLIFLQGNYRDPLLILLMIPTVVIGVVAGLALSGRPFNFFALLGLLGLAGMNIKNTVVLVDRIGELRRSGMPAPQAVREAARGRMLPVAMASVTTILGMLPLAFDSLFGAMAATIMGGLVASTLLTVLVLPALYALFHAIKFDR